jgi:hypothetical protein
MKDNKSNHRTVRKLYTHWKKYITSLDKAIEELEAQRELVRSLQSITLTKSMRFDLKMAVKTLRKTRKETEAIIKAINLLDSKYTKVQP